LPLVLALSICACVRLSVAIGFKEALLASFNDMTLVLFAQVSDNSDLHHFVLLLI
jgi:hypothetical protein